MVEVPLQTYSYDPMTTPRGACARVTFVASAWLHQRWGCTHERDFGSKVGAPRPAGPHLRREREFCIDNLLVRIH